MNLSSSSAFEWQPNCIHVCANAYIIPIIQSKMRIFHGVSNDILNGAVCCVRASVHALQNKYVLITGHIQTFVSTQTSIFRPDENQIKSYNIR